MCCLQYENDTYIDLKKGMPDVGEKISTKDGNAVVCDVNILENRIKTRLVLEEAREDKQEKLSSEYYTYKKEEIRRDPKKVKKELQKAKNKNNKNEDIDLTKLTEEELAAMDD